MANRIAGNLIADNDKTLCELAQKVKNASEAEKEAAKAEMVKYIHTSNGARSGHMYFGMGFEDFRYRWSDDDAKLDALVERLCNKYGPDSVEGMEYREIDMETGECVEYAEFVLK